MTATIQMQKDLPRSARRAASMERGLAAVLTRLDHVGIACRDLAAQVAFYESVFGLTVVSMETNEEQGVKEAMLAVAEGTPGPGVSYLQLLEPLGPDTPVGKFIEKRGEGVHHVGYGVTDIEAAMANVEAAGLRLLDRRPRHGSMGASIAFVHPRDVGGVLTELVQSALLGPEHSVGKAGNSN